MGGYARRWEEPSGLDEAIDGQLEYQDDRVLFRLTPDGAAYALTKAETDKVLVRQSRWDKVELVVLGAIAVSLGFVWTDWASGNWRFAILLAAGMSWKMVYTLAAPRLLFAEAMRRPPVERAEPLHRALRSIGWRELWWDVVKNVGLVTIGIAVILFGGADGLAFVAGLAGYHVPAAVTAVRRLWIKAFDKSLF